MVWCCFHKKILFGSGMLLASVVIMYVCSLNILHKARCLVNESVATYSVILYR